MERFTDAVEGGKPDGANLSCFYAGKVGLVDSELISEFVRRHFSVGKHSV